MGFLSTLIQTIFKMVMLLVAAFGGIRLGKYLSDRKDKKEI